MISAISVNRRLHSMATRSHPFVQVGWPVEDDEKAAGSKLNGFRFEVHSLENLLAAKKLRCAKDLKILRWNLS
jgi:hypothetical protein